MKSQKNLKGANLISTGLSTLVTRNFYIDQKVIAENSQSSLINLKTLSVIQIM